MSANWERYIPPEPSKPKRTRGVSRYKKPRVQRTWKEPIPWGYTTNAQWAQSKTPAGYVMACDIKEAKQEIVRVQMEKLGFATKKAWAWPAPDMKLDLNE